jgi:serine/threonine-protein kinase
VKVLDFGIARISESNVDGTTTEVGLPMGTPAFMAPEQARGRWDLVGARSDLFAVGATMFTLLTGHLVHEETTPQEIMAAAFMKPAPSLASVRPGTPAPLVEIVDRALQIDADARWPDALSMRNALREAYVAIFGHPVSEETCASPASIRTYESDTFAGAHRTVAGATLLRYRWPLLAAWATAAALVATFGALREDATRAARAGVAEGRAQAGAFATVTAEDVLPPEPEEVEPAVMADASTDDAPPASASPSASATAPQHASPPRVPAHPATARPFKVAPPSSPAARPLPHVPPRPRPLPIATSTVFDRRR